MLITTQSLIKDFMAHNITICKMGEIEKQIRPFYFSISPKLFCNFAKIGNRVNNKYLLYSQ